jgi:hypothetical protein
MPSHFAGALVAPTWRANCQIVRSGLVHRAYPRGWFGGREGSRTKSANSYTYGEHEAHKDLYWFGPLESKTLRPVLGGDCILDDHVGWLRWSALEGRPKPPYIGRWPSIISRFPSILVGYNTTRKAYSSYLDLIWLVCQAVFIPLGSCARSSRAHWRVSGLSDRSDPLVGGGWDPDLLGPMG